MHLLSSLAALAAAITVAFADVQQCNAENASVRKEWFVPTLPIFSESECF